MLRWLTYRWLGVAGWVYLLGLALAACLFWLLPASAVVHRWPFPVAVKINGFSEDGGIIVTESQTNKKWRLDRRDGTKRVAALENIANLHQAAKSHWKLNYSRTWFNPPRLVLTNEETERSLLICTSASDVQVAHFYASNSSTMSASESLTAKGMAAISQDGRWLILKNSRAPFWRDLKNWLQDTWNWQLSLLPDGFRYDAVVMDLQANRERIVTLYDAGSPEFHISPDGKGFVVEAVSRDILGTPKLESSTTLSWYSLPVGMACHYFKQWCVIVGAFLLPVTWAWWRGRRVKAG